MSQTYIIDEKEKQRQKQLTTAVHNPATGKVHIEDKTYGDLELQGKRGEFDWSKHPVVADTNVYREGLEKFKGGSINADQFQYRWIEDEWLDDAIDFYDQVKIKGAGVLTSTEFPAFTSIAIETQLVNLERLARVRYNLLDTVTTRNVDQLYVGFPSWNDTTKNVKVGYKENDPIDTINWGAMTETRITIEKAGVGWGFTEEYDMTRFTFPIEATILNKIAFEFQERRHEQLASGLTSFTGQAGSNWRAYTAGNLQSDNRPYVDLNAAWKNVIQTRRAQPNIIISNQNQFLDYDTNTWTRGFGEAQTATTADINMVITRPRGIPWCERWYLNEDIADDIAYVIDNNALLMLEGPSKTTIGQLINPDQRVQFRKEWFKFYIFDTTWGRKLTGI